MAAAAHLIGEVDVALDHHGLEEEEVVHLRACVSIRVSRNRPCNGGAHREDGLNHKAREAVLAVLLRDDFVELLRRAAQLADEVREQLVDESLEFLKDLEGIDFDLRIGRSPSNASLTGVYSSLFSSSAVKTMQLESMNPISGLM